MSTILSADGGGQVKPGRRPWTLWTTGSTENIVSGTNKALLVNERLKN